MFSIECVHSVECVHSIECVLYRMCLGVAVDLGAGTVFSIESVLCRMCCLECTLGWQTRCLHVPSSLPRATRCMYNGTKILSCADGEAGVAGANGMLAVSLAACKAGAASLGHTSSKVLSIVAFYSKCTRPLMFEHVSQGGPCTDTLPSWQRTAD